MAKNRIWDIIKLLAAVITCQLAGFIGSLATTPNIDGWYRYINKPAFNPPDWVFSPVWITLYLLMGIAAWLVWRRGWTLKGVKTALGFFAAQLVLNTLWSFAFFGMHSPLYGLAVIIALWLLILATTWSFYKVSKPAGILLVPYILWVSFAAVLNAAILAVN